MGVEEMVDRMMDTGRGGERDGVGGYYRGERGGGDEKQGGEIRHNYDKLVGVNFTVRAIVLSESVQVATPLLSLLVSSRSSVSHGQTPI